MPACSVLSAPLWRRAATRVRRPRRLNPAALSPLSARHLDPTSTCAEGRASGLDDVYGVEPSMVSPSAAVTSVALSLPGRR